MAGSSAHIEDTIFLSFHKNPRFIIFSGSDIKPVMNSAPKKQARVTVGMIRQKLYHTDNLLPINAY